MPDDTLPSIGHNNPPPEVLAADWEAKAQPFLDAWATWAREADDLDAENAARMNDLWAGAGKLRDACDVHRSQLKLHHDLASKAVQKAFLPVIESLALIRAKAADRLSLYLEQEQARLDAVFEGAKAEIEAQIADRTADLRLARSEGGIEAERVALQAIKELERELKALKPQKAKIGSFTGGARTRGARETRSVRIVNLRLALVAFKDDPELVEAVIKIGNRRVRAKDYNGEPIPGLEVITQRSAS